MSEDKKLVKISKHYDDGSEKYYLIIDMTEEKDFRVRIGKHEEITMSLEDLEWLQDAISEAKSFIKKTKR